MTDNLEAEIQFVIGHGIVGGRSVRVYTGASRCEVRALLPHGSELPIREKWVAKCIPRLRGGLLIERTRVALRYDEEVGLLLENEIA